MTFKNTLAVTTALSAVALLAANAALAAEKPKLRIDGYQEVYFGIGDQDVKSYNVGNSGTPVYGSGKNFNSGFAIANYGEIHVKADGATDSGMKWGVKFEMAVDDAQGDGKTGADEAGIYMSGSWGKLEIGNDDGAADKMAIGGTDLNTIGSNVIGAFFGPRGSNKLRAEDQTNVVEGSDNTKVTYYTPRVSGFQAGVSYAPKSSAQGTQLQTESGEGSGGDWEAGLSYKGKAGDAKFEIALVATEAQSANSSSGSATRYNADGKGIGATVEVGAFSVAGGYSVNNNWRQSNSEQTAWSLGAGYNGGKWSVAVVYVDQELKINNSALKDESSNLSLQAGYNLGGGLTTALGVYALEMKSTSSAGVTTKIGDTSPGVIAKIEARF